MVNLICFSKSRTEWYNPATDSFEMGPAMPVNSAYGLCTALADSGLIYMAASARSEPGITRIFTFDPSTQTFTELPSINVEKRYMSCSVLRAGSAKDEFYVIGGGV